MEQMIGEGAVIAREAAAGAMWGGSDLHEGGDLAWLVDEPSPGTQPRLVVRDRPVVTPGYALISVKAGGVNFSDLLMISDRYQVKPPTPFVIGQEVAGTVVEVDPSTSRLSVGQRVASKVLYGGFSEYALVREDMAIELPDDVPFAEAAALPVVYPTAYIALHTYGRAKKGEILLVHAAAGAVGLAVVQLAKALGLIVIATASSVEKLEACRTYGADHAINYTDDDWMAQVHTASGGRGVDVVFDPVGGDVTGDSVKLLAFGGRLLVVGFSSGHIPTVRLNRLLLKSASVIGVYWSHDRPEDRPLIVEAVEKILDLRRQRALQLVVGQTYSFNNVNEALSDLANRRAIGKSVLVAE